PGSPPRVEALLDGHVGGVVLRPDLEVRGAAAHAVVRVGAAEESGDGVGLQEGGVGSQGDGDPFAPQGGAVAGTDALQRQKTALFVPFDPGGQYIVGGGGVG